jgi:hypothetical protein
MSSTRHAVDGAFHQERFCSSAEFGRGLLANIVAKRCELLRDPAECELIWYLQDVSNKAGLAALAGELIEQHPDRLGTDSMRRFGMEPERIYTADQVRQIREEVPGASQKFPVAGERTVTDRLYELRGERRCPVDYPESYRASRFLDLEQVRLKTLPDLLARICTDPALRIQECKPWWFRELVPALREHMATASSRSMAAVVRTGLSAEICKRLDCVLETGGMHVMEGAPTRIGKTFAARAWCDARPGLARFVDVPASNDDITFFRSISEAIGSAVALSFKGVQLRERIEMSLKSSKLMLVLDNAHYLWPQSNRREALPNRLNWLLSTLVNNGVPVALITTPQFLKDQMIVAQKTGWTCAQFLNQIADYAILPKELSGEELTSIAKHLLPGVNGDVVKRAAYFAGLSGRYLSTLEAVVRRARYLAKAEACADVRTQHVSEALAYVMPSDAALKQAVSAAQGKRPRPITSVPASPDAPARLPVQPDAPAEDTDRMQITRINTPAVLS